MTTQAAQAVVGSGQMSKIFDLTATDDQWDGNSLTDSISNQPLGILIPGAKITHVNATYQGGLMAWRIQSSQTLQVKRYGVGVKEGFTHYSDGRIPTYTVAPDDILSVYPLPVDATASKSNVLAWVKTSKGTEF